MGTRQVWQERGECNSTNGGGGGQNVGMVDSGGTETEAVDDLPFGAARRIPRWETAIAVVAGILCGGGVLLIGLLFFQFVDVYFTIWTPAVVGEGDIRRYDVTAAICVIALGAALVAALVARRWELAWVAGVLLVIGIVAALLFAVPQGRWMSVENDPAPLPSNYQPCYSGSNDCVGG